MQKVAELGCIVCRIYLGYRDSPAEIHHLLDGAGMGQRSSNYEVLPLCTGHHRTGGYGVAVHAGIREWEKNFDTERNLLEIVKGMI